MKEDWQKRWDEFRQRIRDKYRLIIMNKALEEKFSLELSKLNVFVVLTLGIVTLIALTTLLIAFTPLREYIPGYGSSKQNKKLFALQVQVDSLKQQVNAYQAFTENLQQVFVNENFASDTDNFHITEKSAGKTAEFAFSKEDSAILNISLQKIENEETQTLSIKRKSRKQRHMFFQPVSGPLQTAYSSSHPEIRVQNLRQQTVHAIADGNVVLADPSRGEICIQHPDNTLSMYRHLGSLLVQANEYVKGGQVIARTSEKGGYTAFEMWMEGKSVDPQKYFIFQ